MLKYNSFLLTIGNKLEKVKMVVVFVLPPALFGGAGEGR